MFTDSIIVPKGHDSLSFNERAMIILDLCNYLDKKIFVIRETDPHRDEREALIMKLIESGEKIVVEIDTEIKRQAKIDKWNIDALKKGC